VGYSSYSAEIAKRLFPAEWAFDEYLVKPVPIDSLLETIGRLLANRVNELGIEPLLKRVRLDLEAVRETIRKTNDMIASSETIRERIRKLGRPRPPW
jgi:hypothetical protein